MTYGTVEHIKAIEDAQIHAYIPLAERGQRTGSDGLADFTSDPSHDHAICPQGQFLIPFHREEQTHGVEYRAVAGPCNLCPVKAACTTNKRGRQIPRSFFAGYLDRVKAYEQTLAYHKARNMRKVWIEPSFGEGKPWHGMGRFRGTRASGASTASPWCLPLARISNASCRSEGGGDVRFRLRQWQ